METTQSASKPDASEQSTSTLTISRSQDGSARASLANSASPFQLDLVLAPGVLSSSVTWADPSPSASLTSADVAQATYRALAAKYKRDAEDAKRLLVAEQELTARQHVDLRRLQASSNSSPTGSSSSPAEPTSTSTASQQVGISGSVGFREQSRSLTQPISCDALAALRVSGVGGGFAWEINDGSGW